MSNEELYRGEPTGEEAAPEESVQEDHAGVGAVTEMDDDMGNGWGDRWRRAWMVGSRVLVRVSTRDQAKRSKGSLKNQRDQIRALTSFGVPLDRIKTVELLGESAAADADRPKFRMEVLGAVQADRCRIICVSRDDRISRNGPDSEELYDALAENDGFVVIGGVIYDPGNEGHRMMLRIGSAVAEFENAQRAERTAKDRLAKAETGEVLTAFTSGVVWADKDDPEFRRRMVGASLGEYLSAESIAAGRARCYHNGRVLRPFPYPDKDVWKAVNLAIEWMLELRDVMAVVKRVMDDPRWPRPGEYPVSTSYIFRPDRPHVWRSVRGDYGSLTRGYNRFSRWVRQPELYGIYEYTGTVRRGRIKKDRRGKRRVLLRDAFRGCRPASEWEAVRKIVQAGPEARRGHRYDGPKPHWTPLMRCGRVMPDGKRCGYRMRPAYVADGRVVTATCGSFGRHDLFSVPQQLVDAVVVEEVMAAYDPAPIAEMVGHIQVDRAAGHSRAAGLAEEIANLERIIKRTLKLQLEADDEEDVTEWIAERTRARAELKAKREELLALGVEKGEIEALEVREVEQLLALASDLRALLPRAAAIPGKLREILGEFIDCVHIRQLGKYVFQLEVAFPGGGAVSRVAVSRTVFMPQPVRAFAHLRLADAIEKWIKDATTEAYEAALSIAREIGEELERYLAGVRRHRPFSAERILSAALIYAFSDRTVDRTAGGESVGSLAERIGEPVAVVFRAALLGNLGSASTDRGEMLLRPDQRQLHEAFPALARREVASRAGWPLEDTELAHVAAREAGLSTAVVLSVCRARGSLAQDDAGYRYVRRSAAPPCRPLTIAAAVAEAGAKYATLDPAHWVFLGDVAPALSWVSPKAVLRNAPKIKPGWGPKGPLSWLVWLGPEVLEQLRAIATKQGREAPSEIVFPRSSPRAAVETLPSERKSRYRSLASAIQEAGLADARQEDFHTIDGLASLLLDRFGVGSSAWVRKYLIPAGLQAVKASSPGGRPYPMGQYYYAPESFLNSDEVQGLLQKGRRNRPGRHKARALGGRRSPNTS
jgi:DNA invertase Pin-like site-specific DNA recombinase